MQNNLIQHFKNTIHLTTEEEGLILSKIKINSFKKKTLILEDYEICKAVSYINRGCVRIYRTNDDGLENTIYFAPEDWWAMDLKSFIEHSNARFNIQALVDCEIYQIHKSDFEWLLSKIPTLEKWFRILLQNALIASENRIHYKIALNAEERYEKFIEKYPRLESRIAQRHIASYLGISPEFLSNLKSKRLKQQKS